MIFQCISKGVAVIEASYLHNIERQPIRPSLRVTVNRLLLPEDIELAFRVLEEASSTNSLPQQEE